METVRRRSDGEALRTREWQGNRRRITVLKGRQRFGTERGIRADENRAIGEPPDKPWRMGNESRDTIFSRPHELDYRNQEALPISQEDMVTYSFKLSREHSDRRKRERDGREPAG